MLNGVCPPPSGPASPPVIHPQLAPLWEKLCEMIELLGGEPVIDPQLKPITSVNSWQTKEDCVPLQQILCMQGEEIILESWLNLQTNEVTERPDMSDVEFAGAGFTPIPKTLEAEVEHFALEGEFSGTIEEAAKAALAAASIAFLTDDGEQKFEVLPEHLCAYKVKAAPCDSTILKDPLDPETGVEVEAEGTFVNGIQIAGDADAPFADANLLAPVAQVADAYSAWCFQFKLEGTCDKAGVFTVANANTKG